MQQEGEITGGLSIPFTVIVKYDDMGSAEKVCTIHIYRLFVVVLIVHLGNDNEKLFDRLRGLSH